MSAIRDFEGKWFVLYVRNKQENIVRAELKYESVVPMFEEKTYSLDPESGKKVAVVEMVPKYPNYVFVKHDGSGNFFERCLAHKDVVSFAGGLFNETVGRYPEPISQEEADTMFETELERVLETSAPVTIVDGEYKGLNGTVLEKVHDKCLVEISLFNLSVKEWIPEEFLING